MLKSEGNDQQRKSSTRYMFAEENDEFILNYRSSQKTLLFQGKNTELVERK